MHQTADQEALDDTERKLTTTRSAHAVGDVGARKNFWRRWRARAACVFLSARAASILSKTPPQGCPLARAQCFLPLPRGFCLALPRRQGTARRGDARNAPASTVPNFHLGQARGLWYGLTVRTKALPRPFEPSRWSALIGLFFLLFAIPSFSFNFVPKISFLIFLFRSLVLFLFQGHTDFNDKCYFLYHWRWLT
jgi:hypothetical protein